MKGLGRSSLQCSAAGPPTNKIVGPVVLRNSIIASLQPQWEHLILGGGGAEGA